MTAKSEKIHVFEAFPDPGELKEYLGSLKGTKILVIEETTVFKSLVTIAFVKDGLKCPLRDLMPPQIFSKCTHFSKHNLYIVGIYI